MGWKNYHRKKFLILLSVSCLCHAYSCTVYAMIKYIKLKDFMISFESTAGPGIEPGTCVFQSEALPTALCGPGPMSVDLNWTGITLCFPTNRKENDICDFLIMFLQEALQN